MRISDWSSDVCSSDLLVGVGVGDRPGGDRGHAVREIGHARVRIAVIVGADRADDDADRALLRGDVRSHEPTRSEEHTSELQSLMRISYAVFCLTKKINRNTCVYACAMQP